jgi:AraC-like DNA-binding protein
MVPTVWSKALEHLVGYVVERGVAKDALLAHLAVSSQSLGDPEVRFPITAFYDALEYAMRELEDPYVGIHYIERLGFATTDGVGFLAMFSSTVGESMRRFIGHLPVVCEGELVQLEVVADRAELRFQLWGPERPGKAQLVEMCAAGFVTLPPIVTGAPIEVLSLRFAHSPPPAANLDTYHAVLGRPPEFGAVDNACSFPAEVLDRPMRQADPIVAKFFDEYLHRLAARIPQHPMIDRVRAAIEDALAEKHVQLAEISRRLSVTERTLQRQLSADGLSFEDVLTNVRRVHAEQYLLDGLTIAEISSLLAYTNPSAFQRAFKRWTGCSPGEWRATRQRS